jgi:DNA-binding NarL/FixJ family response regulator
VSRLSSPHGCVAKIDYEKPDILLIDITMAHLDAGDLFVSVRSNPDHIDLIVVLFCDLDAETLRAMCVEHNFHGYFCKSMGIDQIGAFLDNFYEA